MSAAVISSSFSPPPLDCCLCPRLVAFRHENRKKFPTFFNNPVPSFGDVNAQLLIVGLAPGLRGANCSGRPFTGDYAGELLYPTLQKFGWATGVYGATAQDGFCLQNARITNAVRCVPPENKPLPIEAAACQPFVAAEIAAMPALKVVLALGTTAHQAVVKTLQLKQKDFPFAHGALHTTPQNITIIDSYHCSRYNTSTRRLTPAMFEAVFAKIATLIPAER